MTGRIDFYFDFSSPYGYLAAQRIEALASAHGREVHWHPVLLGVIFKETGAVPLTQVPIKGDYSRRDMVRSASFHGIDDFRLPSRFPIPTQAAARIVLALKSEDVALSTRVAKALYRAYFVDDVDISHPDTAADVAARAGADRARVRAAVDDAAVKNALKDEVARAVARGVCGSPFFIVDNEPFWGLDRLPQLQRWLASGPY